MPQSAATDTASIADAAIAFAREQIGKPYRWGATGPDAYDCSGLIYRSYLHAGFQKIAAYRVTYQLIHLGRPVKRADLAPGDLVFPNPGHVQLYVGGGRVIEAPEAGVPVRNVPIWGFWQARRIVSPGTGSTAGTAGAGFSGAESFGGNPLSAVGDVLHGLDWIIQPHNWLRIGEVLAGVIMMFIAIKSIGS